MGIRMRRLMLSLVTVVAATTLALLGGGVAFADGVCFNGHNWDNVRNTCV